MGNLIHYSINIVHSRYLLTPPPHTHISFFLIVLHYQMNLFVLLLQLLFPPYSLFLKQIHSLVYLCYSQNDEL